MENLWKILFENALLAGKDTLRCLGLATIDSPPCIKEMDLTESKKFIQYEVGLLLFLSLPASSQACF